MCNYCLLRLTTAITTSNVIDNDSVHFEQLPLSLLATFTITSSFPSAAYMRQWYGSA